jgi:hypothetical protein
MKDSSLFSIIKEIEQMALHLTYCRKCGRRFPEFTQVIQQLRAKHPNDLEIVELPCMAACSDCPAVILDYDYIPHILPSNLEKQIEDRLARPFKEVNLKL